MTESIERPQPQTTQSEQTEAQESTQVHTRTSFEAVTANYTYDTEPSLESPGNTRLIYEPGIDDPDGAACWFYPETGELALSGTVAQDGKVTFDDAPSLTRCPPMD